MENSVVSKGRGRRGLALDRFKSKSLKPTSVLLDVANSKSTKKNIRMATRLLDVYARRHSVRDPTEVNAKPSDVIINLLSEYCGLEEDAANVLSNSTMLSIAQGLRFVYKLSGHDATWHPLSDGSATGNPLVGNPRIDELYRIHRVRLSKLGVVVKKKQPLTASQICHHAELFWFGSDITRSTLGIDPRDIELLAVLVLGISLGLRSDEVAKLDVEQVSVDGRKVTLNITESIKNSTRQRIYTVREWPGNTALRHSVYMDPFVAFLTWLIERGISPGPVFL